MFKRMLIFMAFSFAVFLPTFKYALCIDAKYCKPATSVGENQIPPMANLMWSKPGHQSSNSIQKAFIGPFSKTSYFSTISNQLGPLGSATFALSETNVFSIEMDHIGTLSVNFGAQSHSSGYPATFTAVASAGGQTFTCSTSATSSTPLVNVFSDCHFNTTAQSVWEKIIGSNQGLYDELLGMLKEMPKSLTLINGQLVGYATHDCGGTVLGEDSSYMYVLTAAHCVNNNVGIPGKALTLRSPGNLTVSVGTTWGQNLNGPLYSVASIVSSPNFTENNQTSAHDFALLKLNLNGQKLGLPFFKLSAQDFTKLPANSALLKHLYVAVWGQTEPHVPNVKVGPSTQLLYGPQDYLSPTQCLNELKAAGYSSYESSLNLLCAGTTMNGTQYGPPQVATCPGDSGGPLFLGLQDGQPVSSENFNNNGGITFVQVGVDHENPNGCSSIPTSFQPKITPTIRANVSKLCDPNSSDGQWFKNQLPESIYSGVCWRPS